MFDFLAQKISTLFDRFGRASSLSAPAVDSFLQTVQDSLIDADVPLEVAKAFVAEVRAAAAGAKIQGGLRADEFLKKLVYEKLVSFLGGQAAADQVIGNVQGTVLVMGLQGSGKTTTVAKLAKLLRERGEQAKKPVRVLVASVDFYRPAAIDQLAIVARQAGAFFYRSESTDPLIASRDCIRYRQEQGFDVLILDTAGRLHVDDAMISELQKVKEIVRPQLSLLVLDAMTGQESLTVAKAFHEAVGFEGAILTKIDSDTRGGAAFAFRYVLKKPIVFVGTGEKCGDLAVFHPQRAASSMLGMGDLEGFVELANARIRDEEQKRMQRSMADGRMTLEDFASQLDMIQRMGSLTSLMRYLPGGASMSVQAGQLEKGEQEMKKFRAIISSMTVKERRAPAIIESSRKKRIARGSGVATSDVQELLQKFNEMQLLMKQMGKMGRFMGRR